MKALVIEDNDRLRKSLLDYLRDEGFAADAAANGEEGFYKATNWDYDVIVLDVMIPPPDGFEVLRKLRNAILYNRPSGRVTLRNGEADGVAWVEVEDTGIGIPADKLDRVFERFFRADESRNAHTGGLGLGLAICRAIMHAHGGTITARSEPGRGSTFRIEWPAGGKG